MHAHGLGQHKFRQKVFSILPFSCLGRHLSVPAAAVWLSLGSEVIFKSLSTVGSVSCTVALLDIVSLGTIIYGGNTQRPSAISRYFSHQILTQGGTIFSKATVGSQQCLAFSEQACDVINDWQQVLTEYRIGSNY
jgi:hypothetical protein